MATTALWVTEKVVIYYDDGTSVEVDVDPAMAENLRRMKTDDESSDRQWKRRHVTETDLGVKLGHWEGPRLRADVLLGNSVTWGGPEFWLVEFGPGDWRCRGCGCRHGELPEGYYCLHCDRSWGERILRQESRRAG